MGSTLKKTKINKDTFSMGGGSLADKVANNSRKITILKNIISTGKSDLGSKLASLDGRSSSPESDLTEINDTLNDIGNALALDFANRIAIEKGENRRLKTDASKQKNKRAENRIENALIGGLSGMIAPIAKQGQKVADSMSLLALSAVGNAAFEGLKGNNSNSDSDNTGGDKPSIFSDIFTKVKKGFSMGGEAIGNIFNRGKKFIKNATKVISAPSKAVTDAKIETTENQVDQLKKEGVDEGTARVLVDAVPTKGISKDLDSDGSLKPVTPQMFRNTNIPGDIGGNAFGGIMFNRMVPPNLNKVKKKGTITEITLPIEKLANSVSQETGASGSETTVVPYVSSVNLSNEHMTETPKIHGIILD